MKRPLFLLSSQLVWWLLVTLLQCTSTLDHGAPVEAIAFLPGGALLATAGGTEIRSGPPPTGCPKTQPTLAPAHVTPCPLALLRAEKQVAREP